MQACQTRTQSKTVRGQWLHAAQEKGNQAYHASGKANSKTVTTTAKNVAFTPGNTPTPMPGTMSIVTSDAVSANTSVNISTSTPGIKSTEYDAGTADYKVISTAAMALISTSVVMSPPTSITTSEQTPMIVDTTTNMPMTDMAHNRALTATTTTATFTTKMSLSTHASKETTIITTDWISKGM